MRHAREFIKLLRMSNCSKKKRKKKKGRRKKEGRVGCVALTTIVADQISRYVYAICVQNKYKVKQAAGKATERNGWKCRMTRVAAKE